MNNITNIIDQLLDAEKDAIIACMAAKGATPETIAARDGYLAGIRVALKAHGLNR